MSNNGRNRELTSPAIVVIGYTDRGGQECQERCVVPASLLWSPNGLVELFEALRAGLLGNFEDWRSLLVRRSDIERFIPRAPGRPRK